MHQSFTFFISKLWNVLPPMVRESEDILSLKQTPKIYMTLSVELFKFLTFLNFVHSANVHGDFCSLFRLI